MQKVVNKQILTSENFCLNFFSVTVCFLYFSFISGIESWSYLLGVSKSDSASDLSSPGTDTFEEVDNLLILFSAAMREIDALVGVCGLLLFADCFGVSSFDLESLCNGVSAACLRKNYQNIKIHIAININNKMHACMHFFCSK